MNRKRKLAIAGAIVATAAASGGAYAATQSRAPSRQAFLNDVAKRLQVSPQALNGALRGAFLDQLNAAVKAGRITQAQANQIEQRTREHGGAGPWPGFARPGFGPGMREHMEVRFGGFEAAARYLGLSMQQLLSGLSSGKSLAQIATAHGKSVPGLEQAIIADVRARLGRAQAAGIISKTREQAILARLRARVADVVNRSGPGPFMRHRFGPPPAAGFPAAPPPGHSGLPSAPPPAPLTY